MAEIDYAQHAEEPGVGSIDENYPKLTDWENEPTVQQLAADISAANSHHTEHVQEVEEWLKLLEARPLVGNPDDRKRSRIVSKLIRKHVEWRCSSLAEPFLSTEDLFNALPVGPSDMPGARQAKITLNDQFNNRIQKVQFINELTRTLTEEGTAVLRSGWMEETVEMETYEEIYKIARTQNPEEIEKIQGIRELVKVDTDFAHQTLEPSLIEAAVKCNPAAEEFYFPSFVGYRTVEKPVKIKNQPTVEVCHYADVVVDPACQGDIDKAKFVAQRVETCLANLEADEEYSNLDLLVSDGGLNVSQDVVVWSALDEDLEDFQYQDLPRKLFSVTEYWGFWDIHNNGTLVPIRAEFAGNVMIRLEQNPYPDKRLPFTLIPYIPRRKQVYGVPDATLLEDNQHISSALKRGVLDIVARNAVGQRGVRADALDPVNLRRWKAGLDYETNPTVPMREAVHVEQFPQIPESALVLMNQEQQEAESLSGIKAFSGGVSGQALGSTATGIRSALDATAKRDLDILNRLKAGLVDVAKKFLSMSAVFLDSDAVVRISEAEHVPILKEQLMHNVDIKLTINTAEMDNQQAEELSFMLQTLGPNAPPKVVNILLSDIARLRKRPDLAKQLEEFEPQPDPIEQKLRELDIAEKEAKIAKLQAEAAEAQAKAEKAKADARSSSQKTVDDITGRQHKEKVAELGVQAEGNMKLAAFNKSLDASASEKPLPGNDEVSNDPA